MILILGILCTREGCTGGLTCPLHECDHREVRASTNFLHCIHCDAHINVAISKHIHESQNHMYLDEVAHRINSGEIKLCVYK